MPRYIGTDSAREFRAMAHEQTTKSLETLSRLNQSFSDRSQQISEGQINENRAIADAQSQIAQSTGQAAVARAQEFSQFAKTVQAGLAQQQEFNIRNQEAKAQLEAQRLKQLQEQQFTKANSRIGIITANSRYLLSQEGGNEKYMNHVISTIEYEFPNLAEEAKRTLYNKALGSLEGYNELIEGRQFSKRSGTERFLFENEYLRNQRFNDQAIEDAKNRHFAEQLKRATILTSDLIANAEAIAHSESPEFVLSEFYRIQRENNIDLLPEDEQRFLNQIVGKMSAYNQGRFNRALAEQEKILDSQIAARTAELNLTLSTLAGRIEKGNDPTALQEADRIIGEIFANNVDLGTIGQLQIYTNALETLASGVAKGSRNQYEIQYRLDNWNNFWNDPAFQENFARFRSGDLDPNVWDYFVQSLARKYDLPVADIKSVSDPNSAIRFATEQQELYNRWHSAVDADTARQYSLADFETEQVSAFAVAMAFSPEQVERLRQQNPGIENWGAYKAAEGLAKKINEYVDLRQEFNAAQADSQKAIAQLQISTIQKLRNPGALQKYVSDSQQLLEFWADQNDVQLDARIAQPPQYSGGISDEEYHRLVTEWAGLSLEAIKSELQVQGQEVSNYAQMHLAHYPGLIENLHGNTPELQWKAYNDRLERMRAELETMGGGGTGVPTGATGNFTSGTRRAGSISSPIKFATMETKAGIGLIPFEAGTPGLVHRHYRGRAGDPRAGSRRSNHSGWDISAPAGTPIKSYTNARVTAVKEYDGYGYTLDMVTDTGVLHRFAHLRELPKWRVGDEIRVGNTIGHVGQSGWASRPGGGGHHVHWEMRHANQPFGYAGTLDVESISADLNNSINSAKPRGRNSDHYNGRGNPYRGEGATGLSSDALLNGMAGMLFDGKYWKDPFGGGGAEPLPAASVYNTARPYTQSKEPFHKSEWKPTDNKPTNNYGYSFLARNPSAANSLNFVASKMGVPGVWLADIIANESSFNTKARKHHDGKLHVGLIQFGDEFLRKRGLTHNQVLNMSFGQQMNLAYAYWNQPEFRGKMNSIDYMLASVWGGQNLIKLLDDDPRRTWNYDEVSGGNGGTNFWKYLKKLGRHAGREYRIPYIDGRRDRFSPMHTSPVSGCPICNQMTTAGTFVTHLGVR